MLLGRSCGQWQCRPGEEANKSGRRPSRVTGLTSVASTASCAPCQSGRPLQTTSMRRASWTGTSMFMAASATLRPIRAPASWQTQVMARSRRKAREASTPDVEHAARWSPDASSAPRQEQLRGRMRRRRRSRTRKCESGMATSSDVGSTVKARAA